MKEHLLTPYIRKVFETNGIHTEWGGYYNFSVLSEDNEKMLCHRCDFEGRAVTREDRVEIGWYDIHSGEWNRIDESDSFNWQQGSLLQWRPKSKDKEVIYNCSQNGKIISRIANIQTGEKRNLSYPIYGLTPDGKSAISLNFERSYWSLAYHYQSVCNEKYNVNVAQDDGVFCVDLDTGNYKRIVSIQDVMNLDPDADFAQGKHWIEHIMVNKEGTKFVFLHRFNFNNIGRKTRMIIANIDGSNLQVVPGWREYSWSHFGWKTEDSFAMYAFKETRIAKAYTGDMEKVTVQDKKKIGLKENFLNAARLCYRSGIKYLIPVSIQRSLTKESGYQIFELKGKEYKLSEFYSGKLFDIDGHPSFAGNGKYMLTDSYADEKGYRRLLVWNCETHKGILLGKFKANLWGTPAACDLHPKLSIDEKMLVIDTACYGKHRMMVFEIDWEKIRKKLR